MKKTKSLVVFAVVVSILLNGILGISASGVMPLYENCAACIFDFYIFDGVATVGIDYTAYPDTFAHVRLCVKIQKKTLGLFWTTVDIGTTNNEWIAYSIEDNDYLTNDFAISAKGTYRAVFNVEFRGNTTETDVIDKKIEFKYT